MSQAPKGRRSSASSPRTSTSSWRTTRSAISSATASTMRSIKKINPGIIYCSVTGFGQTGPYAPRAGYDAILQAMGGLMSVTGHIDGEPGEGPMKVGPSIVDYMTGMNTSIGILSALYHRDANGGEGQHLDVCLMDTVIASCSHWLQTLSRQRQGPAAPRHLGQWRHAGRRVPRHRRRVDGGGRQRRPVRAHLPGARRAGACDRSEVHQEQRPREARQGDHGDLCRPVPEEAGRLLARRTGEGRRALRSHQRFRDRSSTTRTSSRAAWRSRSTTPSSRTSR